jgi:hypothetical protein
MLKSAQQQLAITALGTLEILEANAEVGGEPIEVGIRNPVSGFAGGAWLASVAEAVNNRLNQRPLGAQLRCNLHQSMHASLEKRINHDCTYIFTNKIKKTGLSLIFDQLAL